MRCSRRKRGINEARAAAAASRIRGSPSESSLARKPFFSGRDTAPIPSSARQLDSAVFPRYFKLSRRIEPFGIHLERLFSGGVNRFQVCFCITAWLISSHIDSTCWRLTAWPVGRTITRAATSSVIGAAREVRLGWD
jgi:hypothetical protein